MHPSTYLNRTARREDIVEAAPAEELANIQQEANSTSDDSEFLPDSGGESDGEINQDSGAESTISWRNERRRSTEGKSVSAVCRTYNRKK